MQAQAASPTFTHVYAALVAIINTKVGMATAVEKQSWNLCEENPLVNKR